MGRWVGTGGKLNSPDTLLLVISTALLQSGLAHSKHAAPQLLHCDE